MSHDLQSFIVPSENKKQNSEKSSVICSSSETGIAGTIDNPRNWSISSLTPNALHDVHIWCGILIKKKKNHNTMTLVLLEGERKASPHIIKKIFPLIWGAEKNILFILIFTPTRGVLAEPGNKGTSR